MAKPKLTSQQKIEILKLSGIKDIFIQDKYNISKRDILSHLSLKYKNCHKCFLANKRNNFVYGEGNPDADIVFVGEAPGEKEDIQGRPFVGPAGQLFNKMLKAISLERNLVYITNIVKCRPPGNRTPEIEEINSCLPYLYEQLDIIKPKIICALGKVSGNTLLHNDENLGKIRGELYDYKNSLLLVTYHPSALLYHTEWKRPAWEDLKMLRNEYNRLKR